MSQVTTLAGSGTRGFADGSGTAAHFNRPQGVAIGDNGDIFVADSFNHRIRKISPSGAVTTFAGSGVAGFANGQGLAAQFNMPTGLAVTKEGWVVVADTHNQRIRTITPEGKVTTLAGGGDRGFADGVSSGARFHSPRGIAIDHDGNIVVADTLNHRIRFITPAGQVSTLAGSGRQGFSDGEGNVAQFYFPGAVAVDRDGNIIVADHDHRIRKVSPQGKVSTIAGRGVAGFSDGIGSVAMFDTPTGVSVDGDGNIIVADSGNHRVRMITQEGQVTTIAGSGNGDWEDGMGTSASFGSPTCVVVDGEGNIIDFVTDHHNHRIRKIAAQLTPPGRKNLPALLVSTHEAESAAMLEDPRFADVVFQVEETQITAHKAVLASHSEYFNTTFSSAFREGQGGGGRGAAASAVTITIGGTTPSAFKSLLRYLYTDVFVFEDKLRTF